MNSRSRWLLVLLLATTQTLQMTDSANIMFFFDVTCYSHRITVWPLVEKLADLGHNVTFFQAFKPKVVHPKVKEISPNVILDFTNSPLKNVLNVRIAEGRFGNQRITFGLPSIQVGRCEAFLNSQETLDWVNSSKFDLVVINGLFSDCGFGFAHKFGAKTILFSTSSAYSWWFDEFGIPAETSWLPELHVSFPYPMTYFQRTFTTLWTVALHLHRKWIYFPSLEHVLREKLQIPDMPPISEMMKNVNLILMNSHPSEEFARSLPPLVIPIGGMHCGKNVSGRNNEISQEVADFINASGKGGGSGFIYVSFGSVINIADMPENLRKIFYEAFSKSKFQFVWKWNGARPKDMPSNVITADWLPQQAILAHPNCKAFISHGGLLSTQESITYGVPMIVFPFFSEQDYNGFRIERTGRGIKLEIETLTLEELQHAISEINTNRRYRANMKETSILFKDRPQSPLDTAVWWTEYVLRHDSTAHLMPLAVHQNWFQRRLLDVWGMMFVVIFLVVFVIKKFLEFAVRTLLPSIGSTRMSTNAGKVKKS